jgi:acyl dehydratase
LIFRFDKLIILYNKFRKAAEAGSRKNRRKNKEDGMAQAEAFETDFWKDANLRKAWDDIVPGAPRKTIPYTLTKEAIELYCKSVGEDHPIYFDEAYAKTTRYGGLIAPPSIHILLMFSCTPADDWMRSPGTVNGGQSWSYNIPARPNDVITLQARALDKFIKRERLFVVHDNVFFNQDGEVICSGRGWTIRPA